MRYTVDFGQTEATYVGHLEEIENRFARARELDVAVGDLETQRDALKRDFEEAFGERLDSGVTASITRGEWRRLCNLMDDIRGISRELDEVFSCFNSYRQHNAQFDAWERGLETRPKKVRIADGVGPNRILDGRVRHAADYHTVLADSRRHFGDALEALKSRHLTRYHGEMRLAGAFSTREQQLKSLLERHQLVEVVAEVAAEA